MKPPVPSTAAPADPADKTDAPLIELCDVAVGTGGPGSRPLIEAVDWSVARGEFWLVAGLPGCGKSLLLQTAAGLLPAGRGSLRLFGRAVAALSETEFTEVRRRIGFVFPDGGRLFHDLTVAQNIGLPLCYQRDCRLDAVAEPVNALLEWAGLSAFANAEPSRLGRSFRQRVAAARALALEPEVLFLDNPLSGLDAGQSRWWLNAIEQLAAGRSAIRRSPSTLVVAVDDLRPWWGAARQLALIQEHRWRRLGDLATAGDEPLLRELLAKPAASG
jgi:phospholipid/cholesterol/gamma-HCH transport system ATP-binding protein